MEKLTKEAVKEKFEEFKMGVKIRTKLAYDWCCEHKEVVMVFGPAVIGAVGEGIKAAIKAKDRREDRELEELKLRSVYDRSAGMYLETKRPLDNDDFLHIQALKRQGRTTGEALYELGLLDI